MAAKVYYKDANSFVSLFPTIFAEPDPTGKDNLPNYR